MLRGTIMLILFFLAVVAVLPFMLSSLYIDQRGVIIPGHVRYKREDVLIRHYTPRLESQVTVEYSKPDGSGVAFLEVPMDGSGYDELHIGQPVSLHYLRPEDVPAVPFAKALRKMQLLPTVRMANQRLFDNPGARLTSKDKILGCLVGAGILLLILWRIARVPGFAWLVGIMVLGVAAALTVNDYPRPLPAPSAGVREAVGQIKSVERISKLFQDKKSRGFDTRQPIQVVGVEFIPAGRTEPVVAMDLIDAGSVPGLQEKARIPVEYEALHPRTAYLQGATRHFASSNLLGIAAELIAVAVGFIVLLLVWQLIGRSYKKLTSRT